MPLNNSRDRTRCPHSTVRDQGLLQQSYLRQDVPPEATSGNNNNRSSKTKGIKRIRKLRAIIAPGVANRKQTKLLGLSQTATTTVGITGKR
jgi:hypothetical protein